MLKFTDGPAAGVRLTCARAPLFLRVVQAADGKWDALDQLTDKPEADEAVFVYVKISDDGTVHYDGRDKQGRRFGRWEQCATYRLCADQPDEATLRNTDAWRKWCREKAEEGK